MWPFRKKGDLFGFKRDKKGNLTFRLTDEEQQAVEDAFKMFEGYEVRPDAIDDLQKATTAFALSNYARKQVIISQIKSQKKDREKLLNKAIGAIAKAYSIYQLPIYIYDLACFMEMVGRMDKARHIFRDFLEKQSQFKPKQLDKSLLEQRDIDEAIKDAKVKVKQLNRAR